jgi:hypothetical protein
MKIPLVPDLSELFTNYYLCESCLIVDNELNRSIHGYKCPRCKKESKGGRIYFDLNVFILLQLMHEYYHLERSDSDIMRKIKSRGKHNHKLAVIIFFCTLSEVLLYNFLKQYMIYNKIPNKIQERLLNDNLYPKQRIEKLFPSLINVKWKTALKKISMDSKYNYQDIFGFYLRVSHERNDFLHKGNKFNITDDMITNCMIMTPGLVQLFVDLHNLYIAKEV